MELHLTRKEVAALLRVSERSVKRYQNKGLKHFKMGRSVRYLEKDVLEFLELHKRDGNKNECSMD